MEILAFGQDWNGKQDNGLVKFASDSLLKEIPNQTETYHEIVVGNIWRRIIGVSSKT